MLSRLCRTITREARTELGFRSREDNQTRNLNTIQDFENYSLERIQRVIRSYFFISFESRKLKENKNWGQEPVIQESIRKLVPFVKELNSESLHLLITNAALLNVTNRNLWKDIETNFVNNTYKDLPASQLVNISTAFQSVNRKSADVWAILNDKMLNEVYSGGQLEPRDAAKSLKAFGNSGFCSEQLLEKLMANVKNVLESLTLLDLFNALEGLSVVKNRDEDLLELITDKIVTLLSTGDKTPNYYNLLKFILRTENEKLISKIESLYRTQISNEKYSQLSSLLLSYLHDSFVGNEKRLNFVKEILNKLKENKDQSYSDSIGAKVTNLKVVYACIKLKIDCPDAEVLRVFKETEQFESPSKSVESYKLEVETYLKNKGLI